ncbi:MAG: cytidylate kinase [Gammaproteobacteria bacterium]|nr:MAG: cytidylate kinase [Gammaproteobacteria bacterium]PIE37964.1 MAG: cytidylate kinase [Gammaproteobacteria bacterium]
MAAELPKDANAVPVITIDGPSGAGKGTIAEKLAERLGFHLLDSGAVYRAAAVQAIRAGADLDNEASVLAALEPSAMRFEPGEGGVRVWLGAEDISGELRTEGTAAGASRVAVMPELRQRLLPQQRSFRRAPGLIADGRDMGTVVFPDATLKVFLSASAEVRARRRLRQLREKGEHAREADVIVEIRQRDERDARRVHAPLLVAEGALEIDSSDLSIDAVVERVLAAYRGFSQI